MMISICRTNRSKNRFDKVNVVITVEKSQRLRIFKNSRRSRPLAGALKGNQSYLALFAISTLLFPFISAGGRIENS